MVALSKPDLTCSSAHSACGPPETRTPRSRLLANAAAAPAPATPLGAGSPPQKLAALPPVRTQALHHAESPGLVFSHSLRRTLPAVPAHPRLLCRLRALLLRRLDASSSELTSVLLYTAFCLCLAARECARRGVSGAHVPLLARAGPAAQLARAVRKGAHLAARAAAALPLGAHARLVCRVGPRSLRGRHPPPLPLHRICLLLSSERGG